MSNVALYTFGLLDPALEPARLADFVRRGGAIMSATTQAPGFLGRPEKVGDGPETHTPGEDYGRWGHYALPDLPSFAGHDRRFHIATLSLWQDLDGARAFVYDGLHRDALRLRYDWFLKGSWPGYVLLDVAPETTSSWAEGVHAYEALAGEGETKERFTFGARRTAG